MRFGVCLYGLRDEHHPEVAQAAEALGFESVWLPDHLALPVDIRSRYPYSADGESGLTSDTPFVDPWIALAFIAARTTQIRLGTYIYLLPLRHPVVTAKSVGSLDALSGGRVLMGVGTGWLAEEFQAVEAGFDDRIPRAREAIEVIRALWRDEVVEHHGPHYDLEPVGMAPKPTKGFVPVILGGHTQAALRRAAETGDGWIGSPTLPDLLGDHLSEVLPRLEAQLASAGRARENFEITSGVMGVPTLAQAMQASEAGLDRLIVGPWLLAPGASVAEATRQLENLAESVLRQMGQTLAA